MPPCLLVDDVLHLRVNLRKGSVEGLVLQECGEYTSAGRKGALTKSGMDEEAMARLRRVVVGVEERMGRESKRNILKTFSALGVSSHFSRRR